MKLTDLDFDCLEYVLEYLELQDLLNVADSTRRLRKAAELVFGAKYSDKLVIFHKIEDSLDETFSTTDETIDIKNLKIGLKLLRCFGCKVFKVMFEKQSSNFKMDIDKLSQTDRKLCNAINDYCAESLKEICIRPTCIRETFSLYRSHIIECFEKPFKNVTTLDFMNYNFAEECDLNKIFPNLKQIRIRSLCESNVSFYSTNTKHFPNLKTLQILVINSEQDAVFNNESMVSFLELNPQLKELVIADPKLSTSLNTNFIQSAVDSLQNIENLLLNIKHITSIDDDENIIQMKNVKTFGIVLDLPIPCLPFKFDQLRKFSLFFPKGEFLSAFSEEFFDFIGRHPTITELSIMNTEPLDIIDWSKLSQYLPLLV